MRVGPPANMDMASVAMKHGSPSLSNGGADSSPVKHVQVWFILRSCVMKGYNVMKLRELAREKREKTESEQSRAGWTLDGDVVQSRSERRFADAVRSHINKQPTHQSIKPVPPRMFSMSLGRSPRANETTHPREGWVCGASSEEGLL